MEWGWRRRSREEAELLVLEYKRSGMTRGAFCSHHGLSAATLDKYRKRYDASALAEEDGVRPRRSPVPLVAIDPVDFCYQRSIVSATPQLSSERHSDAALLALVAYLEAQVEEQQKQLVSQRGELDYAQLKNCVLEERRRQPRIERYGKHTETLSDLQLELLDLEPGVSNEEVEAESQRDLLSAAAAKTAEAAGQKPAEKRILPKSVLSDNVIIDLLVSKYLDYVGFAVM